MKLLWLSHLVPYPPKGGVLQRSHHLLREVARYHDVYLLSFIQRDLLARRFPSVEQGLTEAQEVLSGFCRHVEFIPIPCEATPRGKHLLALRSLFTVAPYTINWLESGQFHDAVRALQSRVQFDLIHFDTISLSPYLRHFPGARTVLDHHNIESHMMDRRAEMESNWLRKLYFYQEGAKLRWYERRVCPRFDAHATCSTLDSARLAEIASGLQIEEIPNGVDTEYFTPRSDKEVPNRLVFAGGLNWYPNRAAILFFVREVWPRLKQEIPDISMDVVGEDPPQELRDLSVHDPALRVHGFVDDVRLYLDSASVYVCPISDGGGTKLKVLDALAMAKALVSHPVACEGIDVESGRNVLYAITADEYVQQIKRLLESRTLRGQLGSAGRQLVSDRYSYRSIGKKLSDMYEHLVAPKRQSPDPL